MDAAQSVSRRAWEAYEGFDPVSRELGGPIWTPIEHGSLDPTEGKHSKTRPFVD